MLIVIQHHGQVILLPWHTGGSGHVPLEGLAHDKHHNVECSRSGAMLLALSRFCTRSTCARALVFFTQSFGSLHAQEGGSTKLYACSKQSTEVTCNPGTALRLFCISPQIAASQLRVPLHQRGQRARRGGSARPGALGALAIRLHHAVAQRALRGHSGRCIAPRLQRLRRIDLSLHVTTIARLTKRRFCRTCKHT